MRYLCGALRFALLCSGVLVTSVCGLPKSGPVAEDRLPRRDGLFGSHPAASTVTFIIL